MEKQSPSVFKKDIEKLVQIEKENNDKWADHEREFIQRNTEFKKFMIAEGGIYPHKEKDIEIGKEQLINDLSVLYDRLRVTFQMKDLKKEVRDSRIQLAKRGYEVATQERKITKFEMLVILGMGVLALGVLKFVFDFSWLATVILGIVIMFITYYIQDIVVDKILRNALDNEFGKIQNEVNSLLIVEDKFADDVIRLIDPNKLNNSIISYVGTDNASLNCISDIVQLLQTGRADGLKEVLNLYDDIKHKRRVENMQNQQMIYAKQQANYARVQAEYARETADYARQTAANVEELNNKIADQRFR